MGCDEAQAAATLPGDELLEEADGIATRAILIAAPPAAVWPWIAQMGPSPRGGAYTYDWIENLLGLDMHSVDGSCPSSSILSRRHHWFRIESNAVRAR